MTMRAGLLLAAGSSRRFGDADKLRAPLGGRPLVTHAAAALRAADLDILLAAVGNRAIASLLPGFIAAEPDHAESQASSLRAGVLMARGAGATSLTIVLGDMPFVTAGLIDAVTARATPGDPAAATDGLRTLPPACFPAARFAELEALDGDRGAGALLAALPTGQLVPAEPWQLADIDTPDDLAAMQEHLSQA